MTYVCFAERGKKSQGNWFVDSSFLVNVPTFWFIMPCAPCRFARTTFLVSFCRYLFSRVCCECPGISALFHD